MQTVSHIARYFAASGQTAAFLKRHLGEPRWFGVPQWLWRRLLEEWLHCRIHRVISPAPVWVAHLRSYSAALGAISHWRNERS